MSRGARHNRDWQERDRVERMNAVKIKQREKIHALLLAQRTAEAPALLKRPGISVPVIVHFRQALLRIGRPQIGDGRSRMRFSARSKTEMIG